MYSYQVIEDRSVRGDTNAASNHDGDLKLVPVLVAPSKRPLNAHLRWVVLVLLLVINWLVKTAEWNEDINDRLIKYLSLNTHKSWLQTLTPGIRGRYIAKNYKTMPSCMIKLCPKFSSKNLGIFVLSNFS